MVSGSDLQKEHFSVGEILHFIGNVLVGIRLHVQIFDMERFQTCGACAGKRYRVHRFPINIIYFVYFIFLTSL